MIQINNIDYSYPNSSRKVFNNFSLTLSANNIYGLLGKNGTGKTTLLNLIGGLLRPSNGTVTIGGKDIKARKPSMLSEIFFVPEELELPGMTLSSFLKINTPFYPRFDHKILESCLADFELPMSLKLNALSMGQKKKVFMSFALASNTRLLIMDEPTNGLDIPAKSQFRKVIANNMSDDRILIISTHQVHDIESLLDHIIILGDNKILMDSSVSDICDKYSFGFKSQSEMDESILYSEPAPQGYAYISKRNEYDEDSRLNLELLFNAAIQGRLTSTNSQTL